MMLIPVNLQDRNALNSLISASNRIPQSTAVHLIHVLPVSPNGGLYSMRADLRRISAQRIRLAKMAVQAGLGRAHIEVRYGLSSIAREVADYARRAGITRIVVPSHQRAGIIRLVNGSVAAQITRESKVPVEVVPMNDVQNPQRGMRPMG